MKMLLFMLSCMTLGGFFPTAVGQVIQGSSTQKKGFKEPAEDIINGDIVKTKKPWATRIFMSYESGGETKISSCTGAAIGPKFVLTARHCFSPNGAKVLEKNVLILYSDGDNNRLGGERLPIKSYAFSPDSSDLALVELSKPHPVARYAKISTVLFEDIQKAKNGYVFRGTIYGYGKSTEGERPDTYLRSMKVTFSAFSGENCDIANAKTEKCIRVVNDNKNQSSASGDSGGPLMYHGDFLAGIHNGAIFNGHDDSYAYGVSTYITPDIYTWLTQHAYPISYWSADIWPVLILSGHH